ncbi:hypothetical protein QYE76_015180 [Lolium multiflorum]|uniref:Uncharacterized protein n=1 Tax=Lolium multiflorum TaxID=4521 RepID=A0AAD8U5Z8_LOLMU|nr:hypothetical protein QYE76_015180 [Lolium multiflorum]
MVNKTTEFKKQGKPNKGKIKKGGKKVAAPPEKPKAGPKLDTVCYYKEKGHWKRNCPKYLADLKSGLIKKKAFMDTDKFRNMSATYGLDSQVAVKLYKAFAPHYELPKKNFDKYHEPVSAIPYELYTEIMHEIDSCELEDIDVVIQLANRETISPIGIVRDVEVLCGKIKYPADFLQHLENSESEVFRKERDELEEIFLRQPILKHDLPVEDLGTTPPPKEDPVFDLKPLPDNLKYAHIDDKKIYPVIISSKLTEFEEERLLKILKKHRGAIGYTLDDLKGISPLFANMPLIWKMMRSLLLNLSVV